MSKRLNMDITIVGAGLVGLSAAVALRQMGHEVLLVDPQMPETNDSTAPDWDQRIYAISPHNVLWLSRLGVWKLLDQSRLTDMFAMQIWGDATPNPVTLYAEDVNAPDLGVIVEERALKAALLAQAQADGVQCCFGQVCSALANTPTQATLHLQNGDVIQSRLLIAADGANSWVRQQLNIAVEHKPYHQAAVVANFMAEKPHGNIARQWFRQEATSSDGAGHCGILAWLPLAGNAISMVWSAPSALADRLLGLDAAAFSHEVMHAGNAQLGELTMLGSPVAFPLVLKKAEVLAAHSVVLAGDAAHRIHPMAGQGVNLGFRDVVDLAELLANRHVLQPLNDGSLLKRYTRSRKADVAKMLMLTNGLYHLFENQNPLVQKLRNWGMTMTDQPLFRQQLVKQAMTL